MTSQRLLSRRSQAQRHQSSSIRRIGFMHPNQRDALRLELVGDER